LQKVNAVTIKTIEMAQGQKTSRFVAWTFLSENQQKNWKF
jgi:23S rRNA (adenine1618-N6)-methyltransferase